MDSSNIIYLSSGDEEESLTTVATRKKHCPKGPMMSEALACITVKPDAVTASQDEDRSLCAPTSPISQEEPSRLGSKARSLDLGTLKAGGGIAPMRAKSAPHVGPSTAAAVGSHILTGSTSSALSTFKKSEPIPVDFTTTDTPFEASSEIFNMSDSKPVTSSSNTVQIVHAVTTSPGLTEQRTSISPKQSADGTSTSIRRAATPVSPQVIRAFPLTDPFASRTPQAVNTTVTTSASLQGPHFKSPSLPVTQNMTQTLLSGDNAVDHVFQISNLVTEETKKRKRIESLTNVSASAPPKRNRILWSTPAYDPSKDPATKTALRTSPAEHTQAVASAVNHSASPNRTLWSTSVYPPSKGAAPKASTAIKPAPAKLNIPRSASAKQPSLTNTSGCNTSYTTSTSAPLSALASTTAPTLMTSLPVGISTSAPTPTSVPQAKRPPKAWTSRQFADLAAQAQQSFPFAAFAAKHSKTEAEVFETFSAIIQLPIFQHSANGLRRAKLGRERVRELKGAVKEVKSVHKAETKKAGVVAGMRKKGQPVEGTEEDRMMAMVRQGLLGAAIAKRP